MSLWPLVKSQIIQRPGAACLRPANSRFVQAILQLQPGLVAHHPKCLPGYASQGLLKQPFAESVGCCSLPSHRQFMNWVGQGLRKSPGWSKQNSPGQCSFSFFHVGEGLNTGKMSPDYRLHRSMAQHRENDGCPSNLCPEATQFSISPYVSGTSQAAVPLLEPRVSACKQVSLCMGSLRDICVSSCLLFLTGGQNIL